MKTTLDRLFSGDRILALCAMALLILIVPLLFVYTIDTRTTLDINVWTKPIKFAVSLSVYVLTLSFFSHYLTSRWRENKTYRWFVHIVVLSIALEMAWLIISAAMGQPSHFNRTHAVLQAVYPVMGILATILTSLSLVIGVGMLKNSQLTLHPITHYTIAFSLITTFFLTMVAASTMAGAEAQSHARLPADGAALAHNLTSDLNAIPILGWLREVGDLRVAHFFSTHAMHFEPLIGILIVWIFGAQLSDDRRIGILVGISISLAYCGFVGFVFQQAISGLPFLT